MSRAKKALNVDTLKKIQELSRRDSCLLWDDITGFYNSFYVSHFNREAPIFRPTDFENKVYGKADGIVVENE